jgi:uncharacterized protein YndB with AHSA1/START domain
VAEQLFLSATFERRDRRTVARFTVTLEHAQETVWGALTVPARLAEWLAPGDIDPRPGGSVRLNFPDSGIVIDSAVSEIAPPLVLQYSWSRAGEPERPLRFELEPAGAATRLAVSLSVPADEDAGRTAAGWAAHLEMLAAALAGAPIKFPFEVFKAAREDYRARLAAD